MHPTAPRSQPSERTLARVQAVSGLVFASFLVIHLLTALAALLGQDAFNGALALGRRYYQVMPIELGVVLLSLFVHITASVTRALRRRRRAKGDDLPRRKPALAVRLHRISAYFLLLVITGHVIATRAPAVFADIPIEYAYVHYTLVHVPAYFMPYYTVLFAAGAYHGLRGVWIALGVLGVSRPRWLTAIAQRGAPRTAALLIVLGVIVVSALAGAWYSVDTTHFATYDALVERVFG